MSQKSYLRHFVLWVVGFGIGTKMDGSIVVLLSGRECWESLRPDCNHHLGCVVRCAAASRLGTDVGFLGLLEFKPQCLKREGCTWTVQQLGHSSWFDVYHCGFGAAFFTSLKRQRDD